MAKVTMPQLGESVAEGTIGKWLKQPGDHVDKYEPLVEVITDKVNAEVPSPFEGILSEILVRRARPSRTTPRSRSSTPPTRPPHPRRPLDRGLRAGGAGEAGLRARRWPGRFRSSGRRPRCRPRRQAPAPAARPSPRPRTLAATGDPDARMTPAVRRLLREHGLSPAQSRHRRWRPDHPRRRPEGRRVDPDRRRGPGRRVRQRRIGPGSRSAPAAARDARTRSGRRPRSSSRAGADESSCR